LFRLKNTGEQSVKTPIVSIGLLDNMSGTVPTRPRRSKSDWNGMYAFEPPELPDIWGMDEEQQDVFENNGRVGVVHAVRGMHQVLMPGHATTFEGLGMKLRQFELGSVIQLQYRVDAQEMPPFRGEVTGTVPTTIHEFFVQDSH